MRAEIRSGVQGVQSSGRGDDATDATGILDSNLGRQHNPETQEKWHFGKEAEDCSATMCAMQLVRSTRSNSANGGADILSLNALQG